MKNPTVGFRGVAGIQPLKPIVLMPEQKGKVRVRMRHDEFATAFAAAPVKQRLAGIIRDLLGPDATEAQMRKTAFSILGQCLYYVHCQEITKRLFPSDPRETQDVGLLADHIFHFSLGGITALRRQIQSKSSSKHHLPLSKNKRRKTL